MKGERGDGKGMTTGDIDRSDNLKRHMRIHSGEIPSQCDVCKKNYGQKGDLTRHIRVHTGEAPFHCAMCYSSFTDRRKFTNHMVSHTGKHHKCDHYGKSFADKSHLREHMLVHRGEEPNICKFCGKSFTYRPTLTRHLLKCDIGDISINKKRI